MHWQWDPEHNCVLQAESTLIGRALNNFPLYNLMPTTQLPTTVTMASLPNKAQVETQTQAHQQAMMGMQSTNDLDSLSNSTLSHGMWFTTTTNQMDVITTQQTKLKTQTNTQLTTIMNQLEIIQNLMDDQRKWQDSYNEYDGYDRNWPFTPDQSQMDEDNYDMNDTLGQQATSNSQMEDASTTK